MISFSCTEMYKAVVVCMAGLISDCKAHIGCLGWKLINFMGQSRGKRPALALCVAQSRLMGTSTLWEDGQMKNNFL